MTQKADPKEESIRDLCKDALLYNDRLQCVLATEEINHGCVFWGDRLAVGVSDCIVIYECNDIMKNITNKSLKEDFDKTVSTRNPFNKTPEPQTKSKWKAHNDLVRCLVVWKKHNKLISGSWDSKVKMWNEDFTCEREFEGHASYVLCVIVWTKYDLLCSSCYQGNVRIWNFDGTCAASVNGTDKSPMYSIGVFGDYLCGGARNNKFWFWDHDGKEIDRINEHCQDCKGIAEFGGKLITNTMSSNNGMLVWKPSDVNTTGHIFQKDIYFPYLNAESFVLLKTPKPILVSGVLQRLLFWNEDIQVIGCSSEKFLAHSPRTFDWNPSKRLLSVGCNGSLYVFKGRSYEIILAYVECNHHGMK